MTRTIQYFILLFTSIGSIATGYPYAGPVQPAADYDSGLSHLPDVIRQDIESWRERLESATCLKVVCETEQVWANLYELDAYGQARVVLRERFQMHSWMTAELVWLVVYSVIDGNAETDQPYYQMLWKKETGTVWERAWLPEDQTYHIRKYRTQDLFGPEDGTMVSRGCIYVTLTRSWLAGGQDLATRGSSAASIGLLRSPNIAIVPPDSSQRGVWLDVFQDSIVRDRHEKDESRLYRRHDFMLLARNEQSEPEVREWRTIVLGDRTHGGKRPQEITATKRFSYLFYEEPPPELLSAIRIFAQEVEDALEITGLNVDSGVESDRQE